MTTHEAFDLSLRPTLSWWANVHVKEEDEQEEFDQFVRVGWSSTTSDDFGGTGEQPTPPLIGVTVNGAESGTHNYRVMAEELEEFDVPFVYPDDSNGWHHYRVELNEDGTVSFFRDDEPVWTSTTPLDFSQYTNQALVVDGKSQHTTNLVDDVQVWLSP